MFDVWRRSVVELWCVCVIRCSGLHTMRQSLHQAAPTEDFMSGIWGMLQLTICIRQSHFVIVAVLVWPCWVATCISKQTSLRCPLTAAVLSWPPPIAFMSSSLCLFSINLLLLVLSYHLRFTVLFFISICFQLFFTVMCTVQHWSM